MIRTETRDDGLVYVVAGLRELMAALVEPERTSAICREQAKADAEDMVWICEFFTTLADGTEISGEYIPAELPGFRAIDIRPPEAPLEDQKRIADEYHAIPPIIPAQD